MVVPNRFPSAVQEKQNMYKKNPLQTQILILKTWFKCTLFLSQTLLS